MKTKNGIKCISLSAFLVSLLGSVTITSYAQDSHTGGGEPTASDFQNYINKIDVYLVTDIGKTEFPEIKQPDFHNIIMQVKPVVKDERVYDSFGVEQACVSHVDESNRYFQCNVKRLPKIELNNQPTFYRITFHELLFQAGLELPISKEVPSDFKISSRLKLRLQTYQEWVPGDDPTDEMIYGVKCDYSQPAGRFSLNHTQRASVLFFPNGTVFYKKEQDPRGFTGERYTTSSKDGKSRWTGSYRLLSIFNEKTKTLEQGELQINLDSWNTLGALINDNNINDKRVILNLLMPPVDHSSRSMGDNTTELKNGLLREDVYSDNGYIKRSYQYSCEWMPLHQNQLNKIIEDTKSWFFTK